MIAGEDYKRAAGMVEARPAANEPREDGASRCALRLGWRLSRIAAVPSPDLADQLAEALLEVAGPCGVVSVQLGRLDDGAGWCVEATAAAARPRAPGRSLHLANQRPSTLPWPDPLPDASGPACLIRRPAPQDASLAGVAPIHRSLGSTIQLASLAVGSQRGSITMAVQMGRLSAQSIGAKASLLALALPWAHAIALHAVGEAPGQKPRAWLTRRESQVLAGLARGMSVNQIAEALDRSPFTVHDHVKSLHRKLGVRRRAALVSCATVGVGPP